MVAKEWGSKEKNLISRTAYALRSGKRSSFTSAIDYLRKKLRGRSVGSITAKLRRAV